MRLATPKELLELGSPQPRMTATLAARTPLLGWITQYFQVVNGAWMCMGWTAERSGSLTASVPSAHAG